MSNSATLLDTISSTQSNKEAVVNALNDAASPGMIWGRHASVCIGLTWGYYGGAYFSNGSSNAVANGTVTLTANTTNYLYASATNGAVSVNTTGVPAGAIPLYVITTGASTVASYQDVRSYQPGAIPSSSSGVWLMGNAVMTSAHTIVAGDKGNCLVMNSSSAVSQALPTPTGSSGNFPAGWFASFDNIGSGTMTLSAPSGVGLDGVSAGTLALTQNQGCSIFTDGTNWYSIRGVGGSGGGGSSTLSGLSDVSVTEGAGINGYSLVWNNSLGKWTAMNVSGGGGSTAIGLNSGTGYPTGSGTVGDMYRATDGWPGATLYSYVGQITGMPRVVNFGYASSTTTGTLNVTMQRATTVGNLLVAFAACFTGATNVTIGTGWTNLFTNNNPTPAVDCAYMIVSSSGTTVNPYAVSTQNGGNTVLVLEIAGQASSSPVVGYATPTSSASTIERACTNGNLAIVFEAGQGAFSAKHPSNMFAGYATGAGSTVHAVQAYGVPVSAGTTFGAQIAAGVSGTMVGSVVEIAAGTASSQIWKSIG
jgi:hypothetical protein